MLAELAMDPMTAVEIKEMLEREFDIYLTAQEICHLTSANRYKLSAVNQCTVVDR
jgi:fatty acid synthase